ncbi:MAG: rhomboid family intramembrane serine protease, partial [Gammaproteobacteria bacterium]|nr:rhomboid family intramembrane serine protease [Gammaproteobacteria bacterium]
MLPHSAALDLDGHAYTTYAVVILCIIIFYFQFHNEQEVQHAMGDYCVSIYSPRLGDESVDVMRTDVGYCQEFLEMFHTDVDFLVPQQLEYIMWDKFTFYRARMDDVLVLMQQHYQAFQKDAPGSLNASLMYYPDFPNPIKMVTASLSHGSISHIVGNLIFFLAFAPALELLIGNVFKYLGVMLIIALSTGISYSLVMLINFSDAIPTLGLSGVVMGMIGLSAYLMPMAKIRVFVWFFTFARNIYISAWILALWYIGWDAWALLTTSDHGGVNLIAHVSGGITGYLLGYFWLKETREDTRDDLDDEIEYQRSKRADRHFAPGVSYSGNRKYIESKQQQRQFKKNHDEYMGRLYQYVQCGNDSEAIALIMDDYEFQSVCVENYEELF